MKRIGDREMGKKQKKADIEPFDCKNLNKYSNGKGVKCRLDKKYCSVWNMFEFDFYDRLDTIKGV